MQRTIKSKEELVSFLLDEAEKSEKPIDLVFDELVIHNRLDQKFSQELAQESREKKHEVVRNWLKNVLRDTEEKDSFALFIYDAIEITPSLLGVGINVKKILEHYYPNIRNTLRTFRISKSTIKSLGFLVGDHGLRLLLTYENTVSKLGSTETERLLLAGVLSKSIRYDITWIELSHDLIAHAVSEFMNE